MTTLKQLKRQRDMFRARRESQKEIAKIGRERKDLQREIKALKNPKSASFKKNLKRGLRIGAKSTLRLFDDLTRPVPNRRPVKKKRRKR